MSVSSKYTSWAGWSHDFKLRGVLCSVKRIVKIFLSIKNSITSKFNLVLYLIVEKFFQNVPYLSKKSLLSKVLLIFVILVLNFHFWHLLRTLGRFYDIFAFRFKKI